MEKTIINRNWYFKFGENKGDEINIKLNEYSLIGLPHSFGIPYYGENDFYVGYGTYYKEFNCNCDIQNSCILLEFGAVFQIAEIYLNGKYIQSHEGGYTAFTVDITNYIKWGKNTLFVRVNNIWKATLAPRAGEHVFNGGIYRDVYLIVYPKTHIDWYGVRVASSKISDNEYELNIETKCVNAEGKTLLSEVIDADGNVVCSSGCKVIDNKAVQKVKIENPTLWDIDNPYLYSLKTTLEDDRLLTSFGIRTIEWTKDNGFFLNGKHLLLEGANVHQDHGGWGDAVTHSGIKRDIALMKNCGFNFIRGSHYPHHTEFAKECDRQGMLFWSENVFWGIGGFDADGYWKSSAMPVKKEHYKAFEESLRQQLSEMIKVNYNSPSIICWSMGNEVFFSKKKAMNEARKLIVRLVEYCHELDSTRPAGLGGTQRGGLDTLADVSGYNGDGAVLFKNPPVPNMVAEYGSIASYRPGKVDLYETKGSNEYYPWRAGRCIWCGFHHGSIAGIGNLGICDLYRLPLNAYYAYRKKNLGIEIPKQSVKDKPYSLKLTADKKEISTDGTDDTMLTCEVINKNGERVQGDFEITFEVKSGALMLPTGKKMLFNKQLKNCFDGMCAVEARAYYSGKSTVIAKCGNLISNELTITALGAEKYSNQNIQYIPATKTNVQNGTNRKINIINDRPVMVSSESVVGSSICLTTKSKHKYWSPDRNDREPCIILDLENCYEAFEVNISQPIFRKTNYNIFFSTDKENWTAISLNTKARKIAVKNEARYIKIAVSENVKIKKIKIFEI